MMRIPNKQQLGNSKSILAALSNVSSSYVNVIFLLLVLLTNTNYCYGRCERSPPISQLLPSASFVARLRITSYADTNTTVCPESDFVYDPPAIATVLEIFKNIGNNRTKNEGSAIIPPVGESIFLYYFTDTGYRNVFPSILTDQPTNGIDEGFVAFLRPMDHCMDDNSNGNIVMLISECFWEVNIPWNSLTASDQILLRGEQQRNVTFTATTVTTAKDGNSTMETTTTSMSNNDTEFNHTDMENSSASATTTNIFSFCAVSFLLQMLLL